MFSSFYSLFLLHLDIDRFDFLCDFYLLEGLQCMTWYSTTVTKQQKSENDRGWDQKATTIWMKPSEKLDNMV